MQSKMTVRKTLALDPKNEYARHGLKQLGED
jgi:hypothetical protein